MGQKNKKIESNGRLERSQLIQFTQGCLRARTVDDLIREVATTVAPSCDMNVTALVIPEIDGGVRCYVGTLGALSTDAEEIIRHHLAELIEEVIDVESNPTELDMHTVDYSAVHAGVDQVDDTHIMWTVDLGPSDTPRGLLCLFGPDASNIDEHRIRDLRVVGTLLMDAVDRIESETGQQAGSVATDQAEVIMFEIGHYQAIREVFGRPQAESLSLDIVERISECLPTGSSIARVDAARIVAIVRDTTVPAGFVVEKCLDACSNIEISEKILVSIRSSIAPTVTISDEIAAPLMPTAPSLTGLWHTLKNTGKATG